MENENSLATELLHEVRKTSKRWFIMWIITMVLLFITNLAWLYAWCLPTETITTELSADNDSNAVYSEKGDVNIGGKD